MKIATKRIVIETHVNATPTRNLSEDAGECRMREDTRRIGTATIAIKQRRLIEMVQNCHRSRDNGRYPTRQSSANAAADRIRAKSVRAAFETTPRKTPRIDASDDPGDLLNR